MRILEKFHAPRQRANNNVYELAILVYERILGSTADLEIWCLS